MKRVTARIAAILLAAALTVGFSQTALALSPQATPKPAPVIPIKPTPKPENDNVRTLGDFTLTITDSCLVEDMECLVITVSIKNGGKKSIKEFPLILTASQGKDKVLTCDVDLSGDAPLGAGKTAEYDCAFMLLSKTDITIKAELSGGDSCEWTVSYKNLERRDVDMSAFYFGEESSTPSVYVSGQEYGEGTDFNALESYQFGPDGIIAITGLVGERNCSSWAYGTYEDGGDYFEMYYESDAPSDDIYDYVFWLIDMEGFLVLDNDINFEETGEGYLAKPSSEPDQLVYIELSWDQDGFYIGVSRFEGTLITYDDDVFYWEYGEELPEDVDLGSLAGYLFGDDAVLSVPYILGYRECLDYSWGEYDDGSGVYTEIIYASDDPLSDMIEYGSELILDGYYMFGGDAEFIDNSEGYFIKAAGQQGIMILVELSWGEDWCYVSVSKIEDDNGLLDSIFGQSAEFDVFLSSDEGEKVLTNYLISMKGTMIVDEEETEWLTITEGRCDEGCYFEYVTESESAIIAVTFDDLAVYLIVPGEDTTVRIPLTDEDLANYQGFSGIMTELLFVADGIDKDDLIFVDTDKVCGRSATVYSYTWLDDVYMFWVDDEYGILLKTWEQLDGVDYIYETTSFQVGDVVFSDMIDLDDFEIMDLDDL